MNWLWLGYDGLSVRYADVTVVLHYRPALDRRILLAFGRVPPQVRAVVVTGDGAFLPSRWTVEQLRRRLTNWRNAAP